jgi:hypothetical protein
MEILFSIIWLAVSDIRAKTNFKKIENLLPFGLRISRQNFGTEKSFSLLRNGRERERKRG